MHWDALLAAESMAHPGADTRQWVSFGTVTAKTSGEDEESVQFEPGLGPLVTVTLQPSGIVARCRVAGGSAGDGEAEYHPFVEADEVIVLVPEGHERAGCTIVGRLNNEIDAWPAQVGGMDATKNKFAFKRTRAPYVVECADSFLLRSAPTGAFLTIAKDGKVILSDADKAFLALNPDFIGLQSGDGTALIQIDLHDMAVVLEASGSKLTLGKEVVLAAAGTVTVAPGGANPLQHVATTEAVVNLLNSLLVAVGAAVPGPVAGAALAAAAPAIVTAALALAGPGSIAPFGAAIAAALAARPGDPTGNSPGVGSGGFLVG